LLILLLNFETQSTFDALKNSSRERLWRLNKAMSTVKIQLGTWLATLILIMGLLLAGFKIYFDSEPGAIPLLLIVSSAGWFIIQRIRKAVNAFQTNNNLKRNQ
jgi:hypothetical protein